MMRRFLRRWGLILHSFLKRITGSDRAAERDRGVSNLLNDIEVLKREAEFWRRYGRREGQS